MGPRRTHTSLPPVDTQHLPSPAPRRGSTTSAISRDATVTPTSAAEYAEDNDNLQIPTVVRRTVTSEEWMTPKDPSTLNLNEYCVLNDLAVLADQGDENRRMLVQIMGMLAGKGASIPRPQPKLGVYTDEEKAVAQALLKDHTEILVRVLKELGQESQGREKLTANAGEKLDSQTTTFKLRMANVAFSGETEQVREEGRRVFEYFNKLSAMGLKIFFAGLVKENIPSTADNSARKGRKTPTSVSASPTKASADKQATDLLIGTYNGLLRDQLAAQLALNPSFRVVTKSASKATPNAKQFRTIVVGNLRDIDADHPAIDLLGSLSDTVLVSLFCDMCKQDKQAAAAATAAAGGGDTSQRGRSSGNAGNRAGGKRKERGSEGLFVSEAEDDEGMAEGGESEGRAAKRTKRRQAQEAKRAALDSDNDEDDDAEADS